MVTDDNSITMEDVLVCGGMNCGTSRSGGGDDGAAAAAAADSGGADSHCNELCGWIAAIISIMSFGSFAVPIKSKAAIACDIDPLVMQTYKTIICFCTSWLVLLLQVFEENNNHHNDNNNNNNNHNRSFYFTPWGIVSAIFWVPGGVATVYAVKNAGLALAIGVGASCIVLVSFLWGIFVFGEPVHSRTQASLAVLCMVFGIVGMSYYAAGSSSSSSSSSSLFRTTHHERQEEQDEYSENDQNDNTPGIVLSTRTTAMTTTTLTTTTLTSAVTTITKRVSYQQVHGEEEQEEEEEKYMGGNNNNNNYDHNNHSRLRNDISTHHGSNQRRIHPVEEEASAPADIDHPEDDHNDGLMKVVVVDDGRYGTEQTTMQAPPASSSASSASSSYVWFCGMRWQKRVLRGVMAAVFNGCYGGSILVPMKFAPPHAGGGPVYVISFAIGAVIVTTTLWIARYLYNCWRCRSFSRGLDELPSFHLRTMWFAGGLCGLLWSIGNFFSILSVASLGEGVGYSVVQTNMLVSGLWGIFYFQEIQGTARIGKWYISAVFAVLGILLLSYEHHVK
jgi:hypothetical protein